jgi:hypothetical protein
MNAVYPLAVDAALSRLIHGGGEERTIEAVLVGAGYTFDVTHSMVTDISGVIGDAVEVDLNNLLDGALYIDPVTFVGIPAGVTVTGIVFYLAGDVLLCHLDRRADTTPLAIEPDGGVLRFTFDRLLKL